MPDQVLGVYFRHLANYIRTYGTLAGVIAFLTWLYWDAFAVLLGAELNVKLAKESAQGNIPAKPQPSSEADSCQGAWQPHHVFVVSSPTPPCRTILLSNAGILSVLK